MLNLFETRQNNRVLLLDPLLTEGINLGNANILHVLEPIDNWGQEQQVYARLLRMLPSPVRTDFERPVKTIYQWVETLPFFEYEKQNWTQWLRLDKKVFKTMQETHIKAITPGIMVMENNQKIATVMNDLQQKLVTNNADHCGITAPVCDIWRSADNMGTCAAFKPSCS